MKSFFLCYLMVLSLPVLGLDCDLKGHQELGKEVLKELETNPITCQNNQVHLTFDDGPSAGITPLLLTELSNRNIKASFFVTTTNLDSAHPKYKENREIVSKTLSTGHLIANHGHDHNAYCLRMKGSGEILEQGFNQTEREEQIKRSMELLQWSTGGKYQDQKPMLFRFPYGRGAMPSQMELQKMVEDGEIKLKGKTYGEQLAEYRRLSPPLKTLAGSNLSHLGWNHDSGDSSYSVKAPEKEVIKKYIIKNLKGLCGNPKITKVALFHDIKEMNISAVPVIMDIGKCLGLKFISAQEMSKDKNLNAVGVLIDKHDVLGGVIKNVIATMEESKNITPNKCETEIDNSCYSEQYKVRYPHCTGGDSVCFEGKWLSKTDPIIVNNCHK